MNNLSLSSLEETTRSSSLSSSSSAAAASSSSAASGGKYIPPHLRQTPSFVSRKTPDVYPDSDMMQSPIDAPLLTARINYCRQYKELSRIFENYSTQFNPFHISWFFNKLTKKEFIKHSRKDTQILDGLQRLIETKIGEFSPRQICNITWAAGKVLENKCPFSKLLTHTFFEKKMWANDAKIEELAMYLNGLSQMNIKVVDLAGEISSYIVQNPSLLNNPSTSLGSIALLTSGLHSHGVLTPSLLQMMIGSFHAKGGIHAANNKEIITLLKSVVGLGFFDRDFFDSILQNLMSSRLDQGGESLWYLVSIGRCFADIRYDHPKLIELLRVYLSSDQIGNFHDFDLPNIAMVLAEIAPDDSFNEISTILDEMEKRYHRSSYRRLSPDNFLQACWALACTKNEENEQLFLEKFAFTLALAENNIEQLEYLDRFQLYQIALLVNREDIASRLEREPEFLIHDLWVSMAQQQIADILANKGYELVVEQKVRGFSFDIVMEKTLHEGKPVIVEVDGVYHFTQSGKETGSTRLQSQIIRKLGYSLLRVNLMMHESLEWHVDDICRQLA